MHQLCGHVPLAQCTLCAMLPAVTSFSKQPTVVQPVQLQPTVHLRAMLKLSPHCATSQTTQSSIGSRPIYCNVFTSCATKPLHCAGSCLAVQHFPQVRGCLNVPDMSIWQSVQNLFLGAYNLAPRSAQQATSSSTPAARWNRSRFRLLRSL